VVISASCKLTTFVADDSYIRKTFGEKKIIRILIGDAALPINFGFNYTPYNPGPVGKCTYSQTYMIASITKNNGADVVPAE